MGKKKKKKPIKGNTSRQTQLSILCSKLLEAGWLILILLIPTYLNIQTKQIFELDKIMVFRSLVELMAGIFLIMLIEKHRLPRTKWRTNWPVYLFFCVLILATILSRVPYTSFWGSYFRSMGLFTFLHFFALFFVLQDQLKSKKQLWRVYVALLLSTVIPMGYAIIQRLGLDPLPWGDMSFGTRVFGTFGQPNFLGGFLSMILPFSLVGLFFLRSRLRRLGCGLLALLQAIVIFLTASRGALVGSGLAVFAVLVLFAIWKKEKKYWLFPVAAVCAGVVFACLLFIQNPWQNTVRKLTRLDNATYMTRFYFWEGAIQGIKDRPLFGHGLESMYSTFPKYYDARVANTEGTNIVPDRAHNEFLDIGYTTGLAGLTSYFILIAWIFRQGIFWLNKGKTPYAAAFLACFIAYWGCNLFSFGTSSLYVVFFVGLAVFGSRFWELAAEDDETNKITETVRWRRNNVWLYGGICFSTVLGIVYFNLKPVLADIHFKKAATMESAANYAGATASYKRAVQTYPKQTLYYLYLANAYSKQAENETDFSDQANLLSLAHATLADLLEKEPPETNYYLALARLYNIEARAKQDKQLFEDMDAAYHKAAALSPQKASLYDEWGVALMQAGQIEQAVEKFKKATELFTNKNWQQYHDYHTHLGGAYYYLGEYDRTLEVMADIFKPGRFKFDSYEARFILAYTYLARQDTQNALVQAEKATQLRPGEVSVQTLLLNLYIQTDENKKAQQQARTVLQLDPGNAMALQVLQ